MRAVLHSLIFAFSIIIPAGVQAQAPSFEWAKKMGGAGVISTNVLSEAMAVNADGNTYHIGSFSGAADFDPGAGTYVLTAVGGNNSFVSACDSSGSFLWARSLEGSTVSRSIALDTSGNIYITGDFGGTVDFDPGAGTFTLTATFTDVFVLKLNAAGNFLWAAMMSGSQNENGMSVATDVSGNVYTTGQFQGSVDFDPGAGSSMLTSAGQEDIFVSKLSPAGNFIWAKKMGGSDADYGYGIAIDPAGDAVVTGGFRGTADLNPDAGVLNFSAAGLSDVFILKLNTSGALVWARQTGGSSWDFGVSISVDTTGNIYTAGTYTGLVDLDPGAGTAYYTSAGSTDVFVSKLNTAGSLVWVKSMGGGGSDYVKTIATDAAGNVHTTGYFQMTADFDPDGGVFNLSGTPGYYSVFISKLDASGTFVWALGISGTGDNKGAGLGLDAAGNVYTSGYFQGLSDFDPGAGTYSMSTPGGNYTFLMKVDSAGNFDWAGSVGGGAYSDKACSIALDGSGNVYTTGTFGGTADFDPNGGTFNLIAGGGYDVFISKLDANGNFLWAKNVGGASHDYGVSISVDAAGNSYITGRFSGTADFDPSAASLNLSSAGSFDVFVLKLSPAGNLVWAKHFGGTDEDMGSSVRTDLSGNVYTTGYYQGTADFDPGAGTASSVSAGLQDVFISKLDPSGNFVWAKCFDGTDGVSETALCVDPSGNVITTGSFSGTVDFDPNAGTFNLTASGGTEIFLSKLDASGNLVWATSFAGNPYAKLSRSITADDSSNAYITGYFTGTADFDPGAGVFNLSAAPGPDSVDIFISKLNASGNFLWAKRIGGNASDHGSAIAIDALNNVYTTGFFSGTADFDPGAGVFSLISSGTYNVFISKLDAAGDFVWAKQIQGAFSPDYNSNAIALDTSNNIYTAGNFQGTVDFDPDAGVMNLSAAGISDVFVQKISQEPEVWPGDSDHDSVVTNYDLLPIGLFYAQTGPPRTITGNLWQGYDAADWGILQTSGADIKHADCNGDGVIDDNDTLAVNLNFSAVHTFSAPSFSELRATDPSIYFVTSSGTYNAGDWIQAEIWTGTSLLPVADLYGLAFNILYDVSLVQPGTESLSYPASWLGTPGTNLISISKANPLAGMMHGGVTRIDHLNSSGYGKIAVFQFQAKTSVASTSVFDLSFSSYHANDASGTELSFFPEDHSISISPTGTGIPAQDNHPGIAVHPNPFSTHMSISFPEKQENCMITVKDLLGKEVRTMRFYGKECIIERGALPAGVYFLQILNGNEMVLNRKIVVQ